MAYHFLVLGPWEEGIPGVVRGGPLDKLCILHFSLWSPLFSVLRGRWRGRAAVCGMIKFARRRFVGMGSCFIPDLDADQRIAGGISGRWWHYLRTLFFIAKFFPPNHHLGGIFLTSSSISRPQASNTKVLPKKNGGEKKNVPELGSRPKRPDVD